LYRVVTTCVAWRGVACLTWSRGSVCVWLGPSVLQKITHNIQIANDGFGADRFVWPAPLVASFE
jgi:hypothetical protein